MRAFSAILVTLAFVMSACGGSTTAPAPVAAATAALPAKTVAAATVAPATPAPAPVTSPTLSCSNAIAASPAVPAAVRRRCGRHARQIMTKMCHLQLFRLC